MRTLSSFNHSGPDEVPIAILLRLTALKASMGIDPIERRPNPGGHPGWVIPHGTTTSYHRALIQGWVERSDAHHLPDSRLMGIAALHPSYKRYVFFPISASSSSNRHPLNLTFNSLSCSDNGPGSLRIALTSVPSTT